jgi:hypothetical protein
MQEYDGAERSCVRASDRLNSHWRDKEHDGRK